MIIKYPMYIIKNKVVRTKSFINIATIVIVTIKIEKQIVRIKGIVWHLNICNIACAKSIFYWTDYLSIFDFRKKLLSEFCMTSPDLTFS